MTRQGVEYRIFRETHAGGYSRMDHRMEYIVRVNALLRSDMVVLDFGAGRGKWQHDPVLLRRWLGDFRSRCKRVYGADVDPAILENPQVDERILLQPNMPIPLPDASVDLISAFSVLEHIDNTALYSAELARILKPGGWLCAWTPNKWGYVGLGGRLIPKRLHALVLRLVEPRREELDSFPPLYRMNSRRQLNTLFPAQLFDHYTYQYDGQPFYHFESSLMARFWQLLAWLTPTPFKAFHMVFIRRKGVSAASADAWQVPPFAAVQLANPT